jgi:hypothetical protein
MFSSVAIFALPQQRFRADCDYSGHIHELQQGFTNSDHSAMEGNLFTDTVYM